MVPDTSCEVSGVLISSTQVTAVPEPTRDVSGPQSLQSEDLRSRLREGFNFATTHSTSQYFFLNNRSGQECDLPCRGGGETKWYKCIVTQKYPNNLDDCLCEPSVLEKRAGVLLILPLRSVQIESLMFFFTRMMFHRNSVYNGRQ